MCVSIYDIDITSLWTFPHEQRSNSPRPPWAGTSKPPNTLLHLTPPPLSRGQNPCSSCCQFRLKRAWKQTPDLGGQNPATLKGIFPPPPQNQPAEFTQKPSKFPRNLHLRLACHSVALCGSGRGGQREAFTIMRFPSRGKLVCSSDLC